MKTRVSDGWIIVFLLIALVGQSLWLAHDMGLITLTAEGRSTAKGQLAGVVDRSENNLRRRAINSLVWENSRENDQVYYHDAILTLSQSTAHLNLENGTEVFLSENTLVTLEPPSAQREGEIRLRFSKGNLKARNAFAATKIQHEQMTINLKANSEVELRQVGEKDFEVRVNKGEAEVLSPSGKTKVTEDNLLHIGAESAESFDVDREMKWSQEISRRVYTHKPLAKVFLEWEGQAKELIVHSKDGDEIRHSLAIDMKKIEVELPLGEHRLTLLNDNKVGDPLDLQIWQAPLIHLLQPLPRNRALLGKIEFVWTPVAEVNEYIFAFDGDHTDLFEEVGDSKFAFEFDQEDNAWWGVWGKDKSGYRIPPAYEYEIYLRDEPFAAPKLNAPELRKPATDEVEPSASLWNWFIPRAFAEAQPTYEAVFSWQPIQGADIYFIEVAETSDFRHPIVKTQTNDTEFVWQELDPKKAYFWRVAAGSSSGRMGIFSDPTPVVLTIAKPKKVIKPVAVEKPKPVEPPKEIVVEESVKIVEPEVIESPKIEKVKPTVKRPPKVVKKKTIPANERWFVRGYWRSGYGLLKMKGNERVEANLQGLRLTSLNLESSFLSGNQRWWNFGIDGTMTTFEPTPKAQFPFQSDLTVIQGRLRVWEIKEGEHWGFGGVVQMLPLLKRQNFEEVSANSSIAGGPSLHGQRRWSNSQFNLYFAPLIGDGVYGLTTNQRWTRQIFFSGMQVGIEVDASYVLGNSTQNIFADAFVIFGFEI